MHKHYYYLNINLFNIMYILLCATEIFKLVIIGNCYSFSSWQVRFTNWYVMYFI